MFFIDYTRTRLNDRDFGDFVNNTLHEHADLAAVFLSRFPDELLLVAHHYVLRPIVYRELCALTLAEGVETLGAGILAKARAIVSVRAHVIGDKL
jgi:hypothetical protein